MRFITAAAGIGLVATLVTGCAGGDSGSSEPSAATPSQSDTQVTVVLSPTSGPAGTKITVRVPECEPGLKAGLAPLSRLLLAPEDPASDGGLVLSGQVATGQFGDGQGTVVVPGGATAGTYYVGVLCPINLGSAATGSYRLPDGRTADQGYGSAPFDVR